MRVRGGKSIGILSILGWGEWEEKERREKQINLSEWVGRMGREKKEKKHSFIFLPVASGCGIRATRQKKRRRLSSPSLNTCFRQMLE